MLLIAAMLGFPAGSYATRWLAQKHEAPVTKAAPRPPESAGSGSEDQAEPSPAPYRSGMPKRPSRAVSKPRRGRDVEPPAPARRIQNLTGRVAHATVDSAVDPGDSASPRPVGERQVRSLVFYATSWCPSCKKAKRWLDAERIRYVEHDVDHDQPARERWIRLNPDKSIPTFDVAGEVQVGFSPERLTAALTR